MVGCCGAPGVWDCCILYLREQLVHLCLRCIVRSLAIDLLLPETNLPNRLPKGLANQSRQSRSDFDSQDVCREVKKMRAIAEEAFEMVREYKGSHSGEHGDGLVRSEFHKPMFGSRMTEIFGEVKDAFDPAGIMNPGKIFD